MSDIHFSISTICFFVFVYWYFGLFHKPLFLIFVESSLRIMGVWRKKGLVPVVLSTEESITAYSFETEACADYSVWYLSEFRNPVISPDSSQCQYDFPMHYSLVLICALRLFILMWSVTSLIVNEVSHYDIKSSLSYITRNKHFM